MSAIPGALRSSRRIYVASRNAREAGSGKREAGSGKREGGSGKREAGSGKREAGSGKWEVGSGKREGGTAAAISMKLINSMLGTRVYAALERSSPADWRASGHARRSSHTRGRIMR